MLLNLLALALIHSCNSQRVLEPIKSGSDTGLVIVAGAYVDSLQYSVIGGLVQERSDLRLWVYLADTFVAQGSSTNNTNVLQESRAALITAGMPPDAPFFAAGHSLGGVEAHILWLSDSSLADGLLLWAAVYLVPYTEFPGPVLVLNGDMDGQNSVVEALLPCRDVLSDAELVDPGLKYRYPVRILEGVNHAQFAVGPMPTAVVDLDLDSYLTDQEARELIANGTAVFLDYHSQNTTSEGNPLELIMNEWHTHSVEVAEPLYAVFDVETLPSNSSCETTQEAQRYLPDSTGLLLKGLVIDHNVQKSDLVDTPLNITKDSSGNVRITTITSVFRLPGDIDYESAAMLESKMASRQNVLETFYETPQPNDRPINCVDNNIATWGLADAFLPEKRRELFNETDVVVTFLDDLQISTEPEWYTSELLYSFNRTTMELVVQSPVYWSPTDGTEAGGLHYCKLLSPARAFEFMYVIGLRRPET